MEVGVTLKQGNFDNTLTLCKATSKYAGSCKQTTNLALQVVITCPKYLKSLTNCKKLPAIVNCVNDTFIIVALSLGLNIMQTDFLALQIMSILAICC